MLQGRSLTAVARRTLTRLNALFDRLLPSGGLRRGAVLMAGGTALGHAVTVLAAPLLTRLYTPQDYGVLAVYTVLLSLCCAVASLRYEQAIPLPADDATAAHLTALALAIVAAAALLAGVGAALAGDALAAIPGMPARSSLLWLLPLGVLAVGGYEVFRIWAVRVKAFGRIARTRLHQGVGTVAVQLAFGLVRDGPLGLLAGQVAGYAVGAAVLAAETLRRDRPVDGVAAAGLRRAARRYWRFPAFGTGGALLTAAGLMLPPLLLAAYYGPEPAGWFALTQRVTALPLLLIGHAVAQVYFGEAARLRASDPAAVARLFRRTVTRIALVGLLPAAVLAAGGPWLFALVFGPDWVEAGHYARLLSGMLLLQIVVWPVNQTLNIFERQDLQFGWDVGVLVLAVGSIAGCDAFGLSHRWAVGAYGAAMAAAFAVMLVLAGRVVRRGAG